MIPIYLMALTLLPMQGQAHSQEPEPVTLQVQQAPLLCTTDDLIGSQVQNGKGETLGEIREVLLHPSGNVAFLVLSAAGWLDMGNQMTPVPYSAFEFKSDTGAIELPVETGHFKKAPSYREKPPKLSNMDWFAKADKHFKATKEVASGPREASAFAPSKRLHPVSKLKIEKIESAQGEELGKVHALVVDKKAGRVAFAVLAIGGHLGTNQKLVAAPWSAIDVVPHTDNPDIDRLTMATTAERLAQAPEFRAAKSKDEPLADPAWLLTVYEFYAIPPYWSTQLDGSGEGNTKKD